ncbi:probable purple acid phosphatase 20 [Euphorbia lathyris]|uniref:probable purple acid phosphatase 20 n=1 Tax=Euphorbia lathyris TaxID=212925 RepID=UPI003313686E
MVAQNLPLLILSIYTLILAGFFAGVHSYNRPPPGKDVVVELAEDADSTTPQQVHISMVGADKMRITWITDDETPSIVQYGTSPSSLQNTANGTSDSYRFITYKSGFIHNVVVGPLNPSTVYYYTCSSNSARQFSFKTPPSQFPINFVVVGDLGQTEWTQSTLDHISKSNYDMLLLPGDLAYADMVQTLWDSFGRLVEPLASQRPWMVTQGNHEVEKIPIIHKTPFTAYNSRWLMPYQESGSTSNLYYSFNVAAGVHVIMLGSYTAFDRYSEQYKWLEADLRKVDRGKTPWIFVLIHAPWYNSNTAHQGEPESVNMKKSMETLLYQNRVDLVFAGHVHAYERFTRVYQDKADNCGPIYINIGDGGNREGLAKDYIDPKPAISIYREASFGHGEIAVMNSSHAEWKWVRNDDNGAVGADSIWIQSLSSTPACKI